MDVDLLRPGTVPIAPDTVLWFEFLLDQELLLNHLEKTSPEPSPIDLITKFYEAVVDTIRNRLEPDNGDTIIIEPNIDNSKQPAKNIALKILALKVAAFLKWNLNQIRFLPLKTQVHLLKDLLYFTYNKETVEIPNIETPNDDEIHTIPSQYLFALLVYHRWQLSIMMHRITSNWNSKFGNNEINPVEENILCSSDNAEKTINFLTNCLNWTKIPGMITFDCLKAPTDSNELEFNWDSSVKISKEELNAQINYDLGTFFFYKENYSLAKEHFLKCLTNHRTMVKENAVGFATFTYNTLEIYVRTCCGPSNDENVSLMEQLNSSVVNQYKGITVILQQDNIYKEIPLTHRITLELDIQGALSSGTFTVARDLLYKTRALNFVRCVLEKKAVYHCSTELFLKHHAETLIWAIQISWNNFSNDDKNLIKQFLLELVLRNESAELLQLIRSNDVLGNLFDRADLEYIKDPDSPIDICDSLLKPGWVLYDFTKKRKPKMELKQLEQQLIATFSHKEIRELLVKIATNQLGTNVWNINPKWELPIPLQSVLKSLPRGFLQDFGFVMLAKAKELMLNKNWSCCLELMLIFDKELDANNSNTAKLSRLVSWEILLVQITQLLEEWPKSSIDKVALANACEACLQTNESVLPRTEITEQCVICLLNLGRWEFLISYDKRWQSFEIVAAIALACQEMIKHKGNKKLSKNLWDILLPVFAAANPSKRNNSGSSLYLDSHATNLKTTIMGIFIKLRDSTVLTVVISLLTRLNNILKDESSLELQVEYGILWPAVISNANSYNHKLANEMLSQIVVQGLHYYPNNVSWLRLMGDINYANGHHNISLNFYLKSLLIYYDYFNIPIRNDDHVFRRMIKCCTALGCHTQAAVLCQFLEDPDYVLAFRILGEQKSCNDAVDAYYHCFWDTNILEYLIHLHHKKGEYQRRKCATQVIGLLELNSNNNDEIQREAINLRKSTFLRALCKQYVF